MPEVTGDETPKRKFMAYPIGYFHVDIAEVQTAEGTLRLFVAIDRTSKFVFVELHEQAGKMIAAQFLQNLVAGPPAPQRLRRCRQFRPQAQAAARRCKDAGCTYEEGMAITGHKSEKEYLRYAGSNAHPEVADAAMDKVMANRTARLASAPSQPIEERS